MILLENAQFEKILILDELKHFIHLKSFFCKLVVKNEKLELFLLIR